MITVYNGLSFKIITFSLAKIKLLHHEVNTISLQMDYYANQHYYLSIKEV